jgi:hypothetical protein
MDYILLESYLDKLKYRPKKKVVWKSFNESVSKSGKHVKAKGFALFAKSDKSKKRNKTVRFTKSTKKD